MIALFQYDILALFVMVGLLGLVVSLRQTHLSWWVGKVVCVVSVLMFVDKLFRMFG